MLRESSPEQRNNYYRNLIAHCSLSLIHSNSPKPYLDYRVAENLFCECFGAENVSRRDIAVDAVLGGTGIGIKTFVEGTASQKIAEFDKDSGFTRIFDDLKIVQEVAKRRNFRLEKAARSLGLTEMIYHYTVRYDGLIRIFECPMHPIKIDGISYVTRTGETISFTDGINSYKFSLSKNTLYMDFDLSDPIAELPVKIMQDASNSLVELYESKFGTVSFSSPDDEGKMEELEIAEVLPPNPYLSDAVVLPLFSVKRKDGKQIRYVPEASGMNQWNAAGRPRHPREVYISVPRYIHEQHPGFFPPSTQSFDLEIPGGKYLNAKLCQQGDKALMSNPNSALGEWLLGKLFDLPERKLLKYELMEEIKVNAVRISKLKDGHYYINFIYIPEDYDPKTRTRLTSSM